GIVMVTASWTDDGNDSGGWFETRVTPEQMATLGWSPLSEIVWKEKDTHRLYFRNVKKGEKVKFHTRKYNQPFLILAEQSAIAAVPNLFKTTPPVAATVTAKPTSTHPTPATK